MSTRVRVCAIGLLTTCALWMTKCAPYVPPTTVPPVEVVELEPFRMAVKAYIDQTQPIRKEAASKAETVPNQTTRPENAEDAVRVRQQALADAIGKLRPNAQRGDIFSPPVADHIRRQIAAAFTSLKMDLLRDALQEQNEGKSDDRPPLAVNEMIKVPRVPPLLTEILPELPAQLEFDFSSRALILRDVDANVIVDFIPDALPERAPPGVSAPPSRERQAENREPLLPVPAIGGGMVFAAIGDSGTGDAKQQAVADEMLRYFTTARRFNFVLMLGDNLYSDDYTGEFSTPYKHLLDRGVRFNAALGNHDSTLQQHFKPFNMNDREYYAFDAGNARFVALNSNRPADLTQLMWFDSAFGDTGTKWRICFFHHPLYSSGLHEAESRNTIRPALEPPLLRNKVDVVFNGHEHLYERIAPQKGIRYFVSGGGGRRLYGLRDSGFDLAGSAEHHFMVLEIADDRLFFEAISTQGRLLDCGILWRTPESEAKGTDDTTRKWLDACHAASSARPNVTANRTSPQANRTSGKTH